MTVPQKTLRLAHTFVSEGLLKHFPHFSSSFPEFEAKFHTHTLFYQVLHFHCLKNRKLITALVYFSGCSSLTGSDSDAARSVVLPKVASSHRH